MAQEKTRGLTPEFREAAAREVVEKSRGWLNVARDCGVTAQTVRNWVKVYRSTRSESVESISRYELIAEEEGNHDVTDMCEWLSVSRSGYYDWKTRKPSATARRREILEAKVQFVFEHSDGTYGYRRVHAWLARRGTAVDPETIR